MRSGSVASRWLGRFAVVAILLLVASAGARAQELSVLPVTIQLAPGQLAATLTVSNRGASETSVQVRVYAWSQPDGDQLQPTDAVIASPPLATIPAGGSQVVRLLLRQEPLRQEATYRLLLDQIPPPASPGTVRIALRLSIPIFAEPPVRVAPAVRWGIEIDGRQAYLVATNTGTRHLVVRDIAIRPATGAPLTVEANASPYILAGATRRWRLSTPAALPTPGTALHLTAQTDNGTVSESVTVVGHP
jgi:fimbrial chaperone protein